MVSHDRRFTGEVADRLVFFEDKKLRTFEGTMEAYTQSLTADRARDDMQLEITRLQMRLATIAARMSAPKKGDSPEKLNAEYEAVLCELNALKRGNSLT